MIKRRQFLKASSAVLLSGALNSLAAMGAETHPAAAVTFPDANPKWRRTWDAAWIALAGNVRLLGTYHQPVLIEGAEYAGIWQECAPQEALVYSTLKDHIPPGPGFSAPLEIARANHMAFFALQKEDGQLPAYIWDKEVGFGQIQMVVPIAATAWELAQQLQDEQFLSTAYLACSRWDAWLRRYRNTRGTGLVEGFCTYDTGQDNSPRWAGLPDACPNDDARICPHVTSLPRLSPDLSATVYGARIALAAMAGALGKHAEEARWQQDAETIRRLIIEKLYCPEDGAFYDLDAQNKFVRVRSVVIHRVLGEHVLKLDIPSDKQIFDTVWAKQLHNPDAFWTPFPFPSIAMNDPVFVRPIPLNSWGGAAQALTALRAPRWMEHYGKRRELDQLMRQWIVAISDSGSPAGRMCEQLNPSTGRFTKGSMDGYSPAALVYLDFMTRLNGKFPPGPQPLAAG